MGYRQWASNAEPTYSTGTRMMFRTDSRTGTTGYSLAKKNNPVLSELQNIITPLPPQFPYLHEVPYLPLLQNIGPRKALRRRIRLLLYETTSQYRKYSCVSHS